jgi:histidinol-phosphate phosphatase family protein
MTVAVDVVIPSARPELADRLRRRLAGFPGRVHVVDGRAQCPAAARNEGWRRSQAEWIAFLDDDVVPEPDWGELLLADLAAAGPTVAGSQGRVRVPLRDGRRPTDWERSVRGLEGARWATADMAYRRQALEELGGFDERFRRAYREDADLALRALRAGWTLRRGRRTVLHPVAEAGPFVSVEKQAGNADDVLLLAKHGPGWRSEVGAPRGRLRRHVAVTGAGALALVAAAAGKRRAAASALAAWAAGTGELAAARIRPGPGTLREAATMLATSLVLPVAATASAAAGWARHGRLAAARRRTRALLLDRDGTLVEDVPYNGDPERVRLLPGARHALARARGEGLAVAVVTNQSGVGRGLLTERAVDTVNARVEELAGPMDAWLVCTHAPEAGCWCRKPRPGLVLAAAARLGIEPQECVVIGDIGSDVDAAQSAGTRVVLVPTARTLREEVESAPAVAGDLCEAVELVLRGRV